MDDLIALVGAVDGILRARRRRMFSTSVEIVGRQLSNGEEEAVHRPMLPAYRWQYIVSGVQHPHFGRLLSGMVTPGQMGSRIQAALAPIMA